MQLLVTFPPGQPVTSTLGFPTVGSKLYIARCAALGIPDSSQSLACLIQCAVKGAGPQWVKIPPGNWFVPPGSNRSSGGGNEAAEAFGGEGRSGDSASVQAVT